MTTTAVSPAAAEVKVGDFFYASWGYDQTNIDFFKVVGLTPKGVKVQEWTSRQVDGGGGPVTHVVPGETPRQGCWVKVPEGWREFDSTAQAPVETKRLQSYDGGKSVYLRFTDYKSAYKWDGTPKYETGSGWGH